MSAPDLWTLAWRDWQPALAPDVIAATVLIAYVAATRRLRRGWPLLRTASFAAGVAAGLIAVQSGLDGYDDRLLSAHMLQHLLLLEVSPLLLLGGHPALLALQAAPPSARPRLARGLRRLHPVTGPFTCLAFFTVVMLATHLPAFYDATLTHPALHDAEHGLYVVAGLLVWWPVLDADPVSARRLSGVWRLIYVMAAMVPMTVLGAWLNRASSVVYRPYLGPAHALGISAVSDQQRAGAIMWVLGSVVMIAVGLWQVMATLIAEEQRLTRSERRLDDLAARERELS